MLSKFPDDLTVVADFYGSYTENIGVERCGAKRNERGKVDTLYRRDKLSPDDALMIHIASDNFN